MYSALRRQITSLGREVAMSYLSPTKLLLPGEPPSPVYEHFPRQNENLLHVQGSKIFQTSFWSKLLYDHCETGTIGVEKFIKETFLQLIEERGLGRLTQ